MRSTYALDKLKLERYSIHMTIFEAFQVKHRDHVVLETLDYGEAMKLAREGSSHKKYSIRRGKWVVKRVSTQNQFLPVGYWEDGIWYD